MTIQSTKKWNYKSSLFLAFGVLLGFIIPVQARQLSPQAQISVLTCGPGDEIYSLFGHSAIRVVDPIENFDIIFNYGIFSFNSPNFMWRFIKGETDYQLGLQAYDAFLTEYSSSGRYVKEQVIDLNPQEAQIFFDALRENYKQENRIYRYSFLFDNCSSRIKKKLLESYPNSISFPTQDTTTQTFMELLNPYFKNHSWTLLGVHIILGDPLHEQVLPEQVNFLPEYLYQTMQRASMNHHKLVKEENILLTPSTHPTKHVFWTAPTTGALLLLLIISLSIFEYFRKKTYKWVDIVLFSCSGLLGIFLSFFILISEHPAISPNYDILWLSPIHILIVLSICLHTWTKAQIYLHSLTLISGLLFGVLCYHYLSFSVLAFASLFWIRAIINLIVPQKK